MTADYFGTSPKKMRGERGMAQASLDLIDKMYNIAEAAQPLTGRGVGYKLFTAGLIPSMATRHMKRVYRLLKEARERGVIPWDWIVDETRALERTPTWDNPEEYVRVVSRAYRRDFWLHQPHRVEVWSEKGTVRGVLAPVLDNYGVGFRVMHGFSGATPIYNIAQDNDGRPLIAFYVGDFDPSGMYMSERDLPERLERYGGWHVDIDRVAIEASDLRGLPTFPASEKKADSRYKWFIDKFGDQCCELDAMDPNQLRERVEAAIWIVINRDAWERCAVCEKAERESLGEVLAKWNGATELPTRRQARRRR
jgi:hypothetical protein